MLSPLSIPESHAAADSPGVRVGLSVWLLLRQMVAHPFSSIWESNQAYDAVAGVEWQGGTNLHLDMSEFKQQPVRYMDTRDYLRT